MLALLDGGLRAALTMRTMTPGELVYQDPDAQLVYQFDWSTWLGAGITIATSTFVITGPDDVLQYDAAQVLAGGQQTTLRLLSGTLGATYVVTNRVVSNGTPAQTDDQSFRVQIVAAD